MEEKSGGKDDMNVRKKRKKRPLKALISKWGGGDDSWTDVLGSLAKVRIEEESRETFSCQRTNNGGV